MYAIWLFHCSITSLSLREVLKSPTAVVNLLLLSVLSVFASCVLKFYGDVRTLRVVVSHW